MADAPEYPPELLALERKPEQLWFAGDIALAMHSPMIAVVGTRDATAYGHRVTRDIVAAFARAGAAVVSGMARGIDAMAHQAALDCGAPTVAVLGTGIDVVYPVSNRQLYNAIVSRGLVLTEYPPGTRAARWTFPERNRIIAGLASLTIVIEAGLKSGSLKTAMYADALGRTVGVVPGPIDSAQSAGANCAIRDGLHPITSVDDALALAGLPRSSPMAVRLATEAQRRVWAALAEQAPSLDVLCSRSSIPARECMEAVTQLELQGAIECSLTGTVRRLA
jgi:DNA processing protein